VNLRREVEGPIPSAETHAEIPDDRMERIITKLFVFLVLTIVAHGQTVEAGWKGILPLISSMGDVEKAYGKAENIDDNGYHNYRIDDSFIQVSYATEPCQPNQYNRGKFNVPANTVLDVWVTLTKAILLTDLNFDRPKYLRDVSDHTGGIHYIKREMNVMISAGIRDEHGDEYVGRIVYRPAERLKAKLICNKI